MASTGFREVRVHAGLKAHVTGFQQANANNNVVSMDAFKSARTRKSVTVEVAMAA